MQNKSVTVNITRQLFNKSLKDCGETNNYVNYCVISQAVRPLIKDSIHINTGLHALHIVDFGSITTTVILPNKALDIRKKFDRLAVSKGFTRFIYNLFARKTLQFEINIPQEYLK